MTITSRAGLAQCPECDFLFWGGRVSKTLLVEFAIGKKPVVRLREAFQSFLFPEL